MLLCVVGDVDPEAVANMARQVLGTEKKSVAEKAPFAPEPMEAKEKERVCAMEVAMPMFNLAFKCEALGKGDDAIREEMVADLAAEVLFGESSQLYLKLYEEGIIDSSFGGGFESIDGMALLLCSGDSYESDRIREALIEQAQKIVRDGIPADAFPRMKRSAFGRRIRDLDSFDSTCFRLCAYHLSDFDYFDFPAVYSPIEPAEVQEFLNRVVRKDRCSLSLINPLKEDL